MTNNSNEMVISHEQVRHVKDFPISWFCLGLCYLIGNLISPYCILVCLYI